MPQNKNRKAPWKMKVRYFCIGVKDAFRLWHIRAISILLILSFGCFLMAYFLRNNSFLNNTLLGCATGIITGIILLVVTQLKTSQSYVLSKEETRLISEFNIIKQVCNGTLAPYIQHSYPRVDNIDSLKGCSIEELTRILNALQAVLSIDLDYYLLPLKYDKNEYQQIMEPYHFIRENLKKTQDIIELSFQHGDASNLYKNLHILRQMIDAYSDLYIQIELLINKYKQLQYLLNSKFI